MSTRATTTSEQRPNARKAHVVHQGCRCDEAFKDIIAAKAALEAKYEAQLRTMRGRMTSVVQRLSDQANFHQQQFAALKHEYTQLESEQRETAANAEEIHTHQVEQLTLSHAHHISQLEEVFREEKTRLQQQLKESVAREARLQASLQEREQQLMLYAMVQAQATPQQMEWFTKAYRKLKTEQDDSRGHTHASPPVSAGSTPPASPGRATNGLPFHGAALPPLAAVHPEKVGIKERMRRRFSSGPSSNGPPSPRDARPPLPPGASPAASPRTSLELPHPLTNTPLSSSAPPAGFFAPTVGTASASSGSSGMGGSGSGGGLADRLRRRLSHDHSTDPPVATNGLADHPV